MMLVFHFEQIHTDRFFQVLTYSISKQAMHYLVMESAVLLSILVNGQPGRHITQRRGVRQGDSLSPMLFILAMEVLSRLFSLAQQEGVIRGVNHPGIKHIWSIYADDVILFAHPSANEATAIRELLRIFGDASGLRTNLAKCSITEIYGAQDNLADIQQILGCQIAQFPIRYLELPLSTSKIPKAAVQSTVDAVARRLPTCQSTNESFYTQDRKIHMQ
jgi:hypothetical protein